ncbi:GNAT family N-acetyltransferase [Runella sp.]|jgi:GNAT superfamily N-acetyltransferase|uniref:GNAT family N-acetyltransferase n=1 Tax=Runella sp. TaxID=1960881 RepID=UPI0026189A54|nr:GNAT family N-acetyltransferase [Runella sp.]
MIQISQYQPTYQQPIIDLILDIQQNEFNVPITLEDQPDLLIIPDFYCQNAGDFWIATTSENQLIGTIALIDIGNGMGALRKMFVHRDFRGKELGVASLLLNTLLAHCRIHYMNAIYLGTNPRLQAAMRFYEKNGFVQLPKETLPPQFPLMTVDSIFYEYKTSVFDITPATLSDAPTLRDLMERTFVDTYEQFNTPENMQQYVASHFGLTQVEQELRDEKVQYLVMKQNERLIGFAKLVKDHSAEGLEGHKVVELERIYVTRTHHGQKLGAKLMQACLDWSKNAGFETIWLGVWEHNPKALAFYEKMGFQRFGEHVFVLGTEVQNDFLMKKEL